MKRNLVDKLLTVTLSYVYYSFSFYVWLMAVNTMNVSLNASELVFYNLPLLFHMSIGSNAYSQGKYGYDAVCGESPNSIRGCNISVIDICLYLSFSFVLSNAWVFKHVVHM